MAAEREPGKYSIHKASAAAAERRHNRDVVQHDQLEEKDPQGRLVFLTELYALLCNVERDSRLQITVADVSYERGGLHRVYTFVSEVCIIPVNGVLKFFLYKKFTDLRL